MWACWKKKNTGEKCSVSVLAGYKGRDPLSATPQTLMFLKKVLFSFDKRKNIHNSYSIIMVDISFLQSDFYFNISNISLL